ncbi:MAG: class I SAM-dependent methyltransferase [Pseudomonadota bacterium]
MPGPLELLRCPRTLAPLRPAPGGLATEDGTLTYAIDDEIADLRVAPELESPLPVQRSTLEALLGPCTPEDWPERIRAFLAPLEGHRGWLKNLVAENRFAWQTLMSSPEGGSVLEIGCGFGVGSLALARLAQRLAVLDLSSGHLAFTKRRLQTFAPDAQVAYVAGGDGERLPFAAQSFDRVVLYGGLDVRSDDDWPLSDAKGRQARAERLAAFVHRPDHGGLSGQALLAEIRRVLKPDGQLLYAADNGLDNLLHSRFGRHASGRRVSLSAAWRNALPFYRRALVRAGFGRPALYELAPGFNNQSRLTPLDQAPSYWRPQAVNRLRAAGYGIRATAGARLPDSLMDQLVAAASSELGCPLVVDDCMVSGKGKAVLLAHAGDRPVVVKLALSDFAAETEAANWAFLETAEDDAPTLARAYEVPRPLARGSLCGIPFFVEQRCPGQPLGEVSLKQGRDHQSDDVRQLFLDMNPDLEHQAPATFDEALFTTLIGRPMARLKDVAGQERGLLQKVEERLRSKLMGLPIRTGLIHGDLSASNIFSDGRRIIGAIDWVSAATDWPPLFDVMCFHISLDRLHRPKVSARERMAALASGNWPLPSERALIALHAERMALPPERLPEIAYTYWISHTEGQLDYLLAYDARAFKARVLEVLGDYLEMSITSR